MKVLQRRRVLIHSHDTYGLGHLRRSLRLAKQLLAQPRPPVVLIATGSLHADAFDLPDGCDTLKLPTVTKMPDGGYCPRTLSLGIDEVTRLRGRLLRDAARAFRPDLILVDHAPLGMGGELRPLFEETRRWMRPPQTVLGLRDIIDDAARVRAAWTRDGVWDVLERVYDLILVYGDPAVETTARELDLERRYPGKVRHVGYLVAQTPPAPAAATEPPTVVVTVGGGGDGGPLLDGYGEFLAGRNGHGPAFRSRVLTGPYYGHGRLSELQRALPGATVERFVPDAERLIRNATAVVSMAGYNTVAEILGAGVPALLVPRETPRLEQRIRAERLARRNAVRFRSVRSLDAACIATFLDSVFRGAWRPRLDLRIDGLPRAAAALNECLDRAVGTRRGSHG